MPEGAAELAVGDALKPRLFLERHRLANVAILERTQSLARDLALRRAPARFEQRRRTKQTAHMIRTERRPCFRAHMHLPAADYLL